MEKVKGRYLTIRIEPDMQDWLKLESVRQRRTLVNLVTCILEDARAASPHQDLALRVNGDGKRARRAVSVPAMNDSKG